METTFLESGMERLLAYKENLVKKEELKNMCQGCEKYMGEQHDYDFCIKCQGFKFYCELEEYRFVDTFR